MTEDIANDNDTANKVAVNADVDTAVDETPTRKPWGKIAVAGVAAALVLAGVFQGGYWRGLLQTHHLTTSACWSPTDDSDACAVEQRAGIDRRAAAHQENIARTKAHLNAIAEQFEQESEQLKVQAVEKGWTQRQIQQGIDDDEDDYRP